MKYIVETIGIHRHVHVVEADTKDEAFKIAQIADPNWEEYLGQQKVSVDEYDETRIAYFKNKEFYWDGVSKFEDGEVAYIHPKVTKVYDEHKNQI
jgi:hypothetical protein